LVRAKIAIAMMAALAAGTTHSSTASEPTIPAKGGDGHRRRHLETEGGGDGDIAAVAAVAAVAALTRSLTAATAAAFPAFPAFPAVSAGSAIAAAPTCAARRVDHQ